MHASCLGIILVLSILTLIDSICWALVCKPRPDFLSRCQPDLTQIDRWRVGGLGSAGYTQVAGQNFIPGAPIFVTVGICTASIKFLRQEGFSAFPSGHVAFAFGGHIYLTLWLCNGNGFRVPNRKYTNTDAPTLRQKASTTFSRIDNVISVGVLPAAPSIWLLLHALVPLGIAGWTANSRWQDYRHGGIDVLFSGIFGGFVGWLGYRLYHPSISSGMLGPWGPRSDHPERWPAPFQTRGRMSGEVARGRVSVDPMNEVRRDEEQGPIEERAPDRIPEVEERYPSAPADRRVQTWG